MRPTGVKSFVLLHWGYFQHGGNNVRERERDPSQQRSTQQASHWIQHNVIAESIRTGGHMHLRQFTKEMGNLRACVQQEMQHNQTAGGGWLGHWQTNYNGKTKIINKKNFKKKLFSRSSLENRRFEKCMVFTTLHNLRLIFFSFLFFIFFFKGSIHGIWKSKD